MHATTHDDVPLTREHVQALSSADQLADFFARLRYPSGARVPMTPQSLQLNAALTDATRRVERLVTVAGGALQVYLFELSSVTVARTHALARALRDRAGNFLLVLTDDYRRIDFVLLEREIPGLNGTSASPRRVLVRPRVLSIDRRDPGRVALRVLRRFTFTEYDPAGRPDPYAQWDKLNSAYTVAEWSEPLFNNRALFSDYYLNQRLPELDQWNAPGRNRAFRRIRAQFAQARQRFADADAATTRDELIRPLLEALDFRVAPAPGGDEPDFHLYPAPGAGESSDRACAFVLAYPWNRYLDGQDAQRDDERPQENPGAQVVSLLESGAADWGIVTNGKLWRLYSARAHSRATNYYEIDLEETLASPDPGQAFRYFYLFFRAQAFAPLPDPKGFGKPLGSPIESPTPAFLDWLMEQSDAYARELGQRLKERVFQHVFPHFAAGFIQALETRAGLSGPEALLALDQEEREAQLQLVYQATLTFLYRLLFLLYAESRDLLPVREARGYYQISLRKLKEEIAERAGPLEDQVAARLERAYDDQLPSPSRGGAGGGVTLYDRLLELFAVIDRGSRACNVPVYNGGLFITAPQVPGTSPGAASAREAREDEAGTKMPGTSEIEIARFLQRTKLPDRHLALGLDRLARDVDPKRGDLGFIDYKSLGVRQLGSIYEGLLEFHLTIDGEGAKPDASPVHLVSDKGQRKATGSYYTPDYIVKYIVRHTVGPVLDQKLDALRPRLQEAERRFHRALRHKREIEGVAPDEPALLRSVTGDLLHDLFDVKILDPATGSGHFLVEAVDYVTDRLVRFLDGFPFLGVFFEGLRTAILGEMERQQVTVDPARLTDVTLLKRHVLKRCIYGVDLNPMAVELAKVSLWLDCFTLGAPLSFLDHHLRCGNSLVGAMAREVEQQMGGPTPAGQMTFLTGPFAGLLRAAEIMRGISAIADVTLEQVRESGHLFQAFDRAATPYKRLLDIHVARHFGVERAAEFLTLYGAEALEADPKELGKPYREVVERTRELYDEKRFFHWDLEFPEVFIDLERATWKADGGFDAVVGNPPYVRVQEIRRQDPSIVTYFTNIFESASRNFDIYLLFLEKGLNLGRRIGLIVPNKFFVSRYGRNLRELIGKRQALTGVVDFKDFQVFPEVTTYTSLVFLSSNPVEAIAYTDASSGTISDQEQGALPIESYSTGDVWNFVSVVEQRVMEKIKRPSAPLLEIADRIIVGIQTSADAVYILNLIEAKGDLGIFYSDSLGGKVELEMEIMKPIVSGRHVDRYSPPRSSEFLIFPYLVSGEDATLMTKQQFRQSYPNTWRYLRRNESALRGRERGKMDQEEWWAFVYPKNLTKQETPKVMVPRLVPYLQSTADAYGEVYLDNVDVNGVLIDEKARYDIFYLTSCLNSSAVNYVFIRTAGRFHSDYFSANKQFIKSLPIRRIHFTTPQAERQRLAADLIARYERGEHQALLAEIETLLPKTADGDFRAFQPNATGAEEKSDVVHDLLAHLAEHMIALHKQKQQRVSAFWDALESITDADTFEDLSERGKWESSLWKDPACRPYVDQQSRSTRHLHESLAWDEACFVAFARMLAGKTSVTGPIIDVYREHHPPYKRLVERIASTDELIDQIVYRLYGLTEEEIAVVEGTE